MMNQLLLRLIVLAASLLLLWAGTRIVIYIAQQTPPPERSWVALTGAIGVLGAPVIGLLLVELISGRALTGGFRVIRRREAPSEYWFYVATPFRAADHYGFCSSARAEVARQARRRGPHAAC